MASTTMTSKWQMVVPKEVREHLGIRAGDQLDFVIRDNGDVVVRPAGTDVRQLRGLLRRKGAKPVSVQQMRQAVRRRAAGRS